MSSLETQRQIAVAVGRAGAGIGYLGNDLVGDTGFNVAVQNEQNDHRGNEQAIEGSKARDSKSKNAGNEEGHNQEPDSLAYALDSAKGFGALVDRVAKLVPDHDGHFAAVRQEDRKASIDIPGGSEGDLVVDRVIVRSNRRGFDIPGCGFFRR